MLKSKITGGPVRHLFDTLVLEKYEIGYYQCEQTGFIQTEEPFWLEEAYSSAITSLDLGLLGRNQHFAQICSRIIESQFDPTERFIDYAGGYGVFTRLMRDRGYDFYHQDPYCQNLFAKLFDVTDSKIGTKYELATAFEVLEHLNDPLSEIEKMLTYSDSLLFSTELVPTTKRIQSATDWWYFIPETGQHIAMYTLPALEAIATRLGLSFESNGTSLHLFSRRSIKPGLLRNLPARHSVGSYAKLALRMLDPRILKNIMDQHLNDTARRRQGLLESDFRLAQERGKQLGS